MSHTREPWQDGGAAMKERPILFSAPMVRAILEGRKTQTRRVVKDNAKCGVDIIGENGIGVIWDKCPYGQPGDRMWVRESLEYMPLSWSGEGSSEEDRLDIFYPADGRTVRNVETPDDWCAPDRKGNTPSIHMPRWASRITLEITGVRVERLNDISYGDCIDEGIHYNAGQINAGVAAECIASFQQLWESINGAGSWQQNPWVWVVEFKVVKP